MSNFFRGACPQTSLVRAWLCTLDFSGSPQALLCLSAITKLIVATQSLHNTHTSGVSLHFSGCSTAVQCGISSCYLSHTMTTDYEIWLQKSYLIANLAITFS